VTIDFAGLADLVRGADSFVVAAHERPDGDAVGSSLAMGLLLEALGKSVVVYNSDEIPYNFQFLPGSRLWRRDLEGVDKPDVTLMLDCGEPGRVGAGFPANGWGDAIAVLDHHKTFDPDFATHYFRDPAAAATGELVFGLAEELGIRPDGFAENVYCTLVTDTGGFRYECTSQRVFAIAGELVADGVNPWNVSSHIYESQPVERLELLADVLKTLRVSDDGRLAFLRVETETVAATGATLEMIDGFINYARSIRGVEVATQLKQTGPQQWRISFRSRGTVDVSQLAQRFGGGGHHNAAGCSMTGAAPELERQLAEALVAMLDG
jgi:phosphoesterase RecJ-like protein